MIRIVLLIRTLVSGTLENSNFYVQIVIGCVDRFIFLGADVKVSNHGPAADNDRHQI